MADDPRITADRLTALCHARGRTLPMHVATRYAAALEAARPAAHLDTTLRVCQFIGQIATETGGFQWLVESLKYRDPVRLQHMFQGTIHTVEEASALIAQGEQAIANRVYGGRYGNTGPDDGWRYRGRGFIMVTFRANYLTAGRDSHQPLADTPDLLGEPTHAATASMAYWTARRINNAADTGNPATVTRLVNPAMVALADRTAWFRTATRIWAAPP